MNKSIEKLGAVVLASLFFSTVLHSTVEATTKNFNLPESTSQTQSHVINLPKVNEVINITSHVGGNIMVEDINGDNVLLKMTGGNYSRRIQTGGSPAAYSTVTNQSSSYYNDGTFSGPLQPYVISGSYTPSVTKETSEVRTSRSNNLASTISYNDGQYRGILVGQGVTSQYVSDGYNSSTGYFQDTGYYQDTGYNKDTGYYDYWIPIAGHDACRAAGFVESCYTSGWVSTGQEWVSTGQEWVSTGQEWVTTGYTWIDTSYTEYRQVYTGSVTKDAVDTRVYRYQGTVSKPDTRTYLSYYQYEFSVEYDDNTPPSTPDAITGIPKYVKGGDTITVSWTPSTDIDNDPLTYELSFRDDMANTLVKRGIMGTSYQYAVPLINTSKAEFIVRANDGSVYSASRGMLTNFIIDSTKPDIAYNTNSRDWSTEAIEVKVNVTDSGFSGFKESRYAWTQSSAKPTDGWSDWETKSAYNVNQSADGTWYLHVEARDNAGNTSYRSSGVFKLDNSPPELTVDFSSINSVKSFSYNVSKQLKFTGTVNENNKEQGVKVFYYIVDNETGEKVTPTDVSLLDQANEVTNIGFEGSYDIAPTLKDGNYKLVVYSKNSFGLMSTASVNFTVQQPKTAATISVTVSPQPSGVWENQFKTVYVSNSGEAILLKDAVKKYEITGSVEPPSTYTRTLPSDQKVTLNRIGENYLHIQYELADGTTVISTAGPYKIDTAAVGTFTAALVDASGKSLTGWSSGEATLKVSNPAPTSISGFQKEYRIENVHLSWQPYTEGQKVSLEGEQRILVRIVNGAGTSSPIQVLQLKSDLTPPKVKALNLEKTEDGKYNVAVMATDEGSGVSEVTLSGTTQKLLFRNGQYELNQLAAKPSGVILKDNAGNQTASTAFAKEAKMTFAAPYQISADAYRDDVKVTISEGTDLALKTDNKIYDCAAASCEYVIPQNMLLKAINRDGVKETKTAVRIENIDKSKRQLLLEGKRDSSNPKSMAFNWNYSVTNGELICDVGGSTLKQAVSGTETTVSGTNQTYDCRIVATYGGEELQSNRVILYPTASAEIEAEGIVKEKIQTNIYIDESKYGTGYLINAKSNNYKYDEVAFPKNRITAN